MIALVVILSPFAAFPCGSINGYPSADDYGILGFSVPFALLLTPTIALCLAYGHASVEESDNFKMWSEQYRYFGKTFYWTKFVVPLLAYVGYIVVSVGVCQSLWSNDSAAIAQILIVCGQLLVSFLMTAAMQLFYCSKPQLEGVEKKKINGV